MSLEKLKEELKALRRAFELSGARGIEIAEALDRLEEEIEREASGKRVYGSSKKLR